MKYIKKYEDNTYNHLNIKKFNIIEDKLTHYLFILKLISKTSYELTVKQLYHCPKNGILIKDDLKYTTINSQLPDYNFIYHSNILQDCIDKIELLNATNKYNL